MAKDVFSVPVFLVVFRETLETVIIVSVLLAFLKQTLDGPDSDGKTYKTLRRQVSRVPCCYSRPLCTSGRVLIFPMFGRSGWVSPLAS